MRILFATLIVAGWCLSATAGRADNAEKEAKAAFGQGKTLFGEGKYDRAAAAFRKAHELRPNWRLLYNIAQSEAAAKRPGLALQAFEAYLAKGGDDVPVERRDECVAEVKRLGAMVGEVDVVAPDGTVVFVNGAERERTPLPGPMMVAAGIKHDIRMELDGAVILERPVRVSSGKRVTVRAKGSESEETSPVIDPGSEKEPADTGLGELEKEKKPLVTGGWVTLGVGAALLIGGGITGGMVLSLDDDLQGRCDGGVCVESDRSDVDKLDNLALTTDILIGVGAAAAATGIVLLIVGNGEEEEPASGVAVTPLLRPGFTGLGIEGRF